MGIRFLCHHCEKRLNVKTSQAGENGQCPFCKEMISVPIESTIPDSAVIARRAKQKTAQTDADSTIDLTSADDQVTPVGMPADVQALADVQASGAINGPSTAKIKTKSKPKAPKKSKSSTKLKPREVGEVRAPSPAIPKTKQAAPKSGGDRLFMLDKPALPPSMGKVDPIAQAPKKVWYFRSREMGERGPLKGKEMQKFVDSGDVKIGCIVWREDWEDWIPAEKVFPDLAAQAKAQRQKSLMNRAFKDANYQIPDKFDPNSALNRKRRRKNYIFIAAIAIGILTIGGLVIVLVNLLSN